MLWEVKIFGRINGRGLFDLYCDGRWVLVRKLYDECKQYVLTHAADTDMYIEPNISTKQRTVADVKAEWETLRFKGE